MYRIRQNQSVRPALVRSLNRRILARIPLKPQRNVEQLVRIHRVRSERKQRREQREQEEKKEEKKESPARYEKIGLYDVYKLTRLSGIDQKHNDEDTTNTVDKFIRNSKRRLELDGDKEYFVSVKVQLLNPETGVYSYMTFPRPNEKYRVSGTVDLRNIMYALIEAFFERRSDVLAVQYTLVLDKILSFTVMPVDALDFTKRKNVKTPLHEMTMKGTALMYKLLRDIDPNVRNEIGMCVIDYIWKVICESNAGPLPFMKTYTKDKLIRDFAEIVRRDAKSNTGALKVKQDLGNPARKEGSWGGSPLDEQMELACTAAGRQILYENLIKETGITLAQIIEWAETHPTNIYALDYRGANIEHLTVKDRCKLSLTFIVNNGHLYEITDKKTHEHVTKAKSLDVCETKFNIKYAANDYAVVPTADEIKWDTKNDVVLVTDTNDLSTLASQIANETKTFVTDMKFKGANVIAFRHPTNGKVVVCSPRFKIRKELCDYFFNTEKLQDFKFANQTIAAISLSLFKNKYGGLPTSVYPPELFDSIFDATNRCIGPYIAAKIPYTLPKANGFSPRVVAIDTKRSYTSNFINNKHPYSVYLGFEWSEVFDTDSHVDNGVLVPGYYYINRDWTACNATIYKSAGYYPVNIVQELIARKCITTDNLTRVLRPRFVAPAHYFKKFAKDNYDLEQKGLISSSKELINMLWGVLGKKESVKTYGTIVDSYEAAIDTYRYEWHTKERFVEMNQYNDLYFIQSSSIRKLNSGCVPVHHQILAAGWLQLMKIHDMFSQHGQVLGYHTDCMKLLITSQADYDAVKAKIKESESMPLGDYYRMDHDDKLEDYLKKEFGQPPLNVDVTETHAYPYTTRDWKEVTLETGKPPAESCFITGMPGCGKTTLLASIVTKLNEEKKKTECVAFQHRVVAVLKEKDVDCARVIDSLLNLEKGESKIRQDLADLAYLLIDEISAVPKKHLRTLYRLMNPRTILLLFGDKDQNKSIEKDDIDKNTYIYDETPIFKRLCGNNRYQMKYIVGCGRYDQGLLDVVNSVRTKGILPPCEVKAPKDITDIKVHITPWNHHRHELNKKCFDADRLSAPPQNVITIPGRSKFMDDGKNKQYPKDINETQYVVGMPLICVENPSKSGKGERKSMPIVHNGDTFRVKGRTNTGLELLNDINKKVITVPDDVLRRRFDYAYAFTVHKIQGSEIKCAYMIHHIRKMVRQQGYVGLSRGKRLSDVIWMENEEIKFAEDAPNSYITEMYTPPKPKLMYIYSLSTPESPKQIYIGQTTTTLEKRCAWHMEDPTSSVMAEYINKYRNTIKIAPLAVYGSITKEKLDQYEREFIQEYAHKYDDCLNDKHNPKKHPSELKEVKQIAPVTKVDIVRPTCNIKRPAVIDETSANRFRVTDGKSKTSFSYGKGASAEKKEATRKEAQAFADNIYKQRGGW